MDRRQHVGARRRQMFLDAGPEADLMEKFIAGAVTAATIGGAGTLDLNGSFTGTTLDYDADGTVIVADSNSTPLYYSSGNYGVHALLFTDGKGNTFYFSYETLIAFRPANKSRVYCLKNYWHTTTGKHLNWIDPDKKKRVSRDDFDRLYTEQTAA